MRVKSVARHRNGTSGNPFYVVLFDDKGGLKNMVGIVFDEQPGSVAVLSVAELAKGNIAFGHGNSWYGDQFEPALRRACVTYDEKMKAAKDGIEIARVMYGGPRVWKGVHV